MLMTVRSPVKQYFAPKEAVIAKFEKLNKKSVSLYVLELLKKHFQVLLARITNSNLNRQVNLLWSKDNFPVKTNDFCLTNE